MNIQTALESAQEKTTASLQGEDRHQNTLSDESGRVVGGQVGFQEVSPRIKSRKFWHLVAGCSLKLIGAGVRNQLSQGRCAE